MKKPKVTPAPKATASLETIIHSDTNGRPSTMLVDLTGLTPAKANYILNCTRILMLEIKLSGSSAQAFQQA